MPSVNNNTYSSKLIIGLILLTNIIPPLSVDEYTPSLPPMMHALHTSIATLQLSVTFYMFTFAISQIICGSLADHYGRRVVLLANTPIFFIGSFFCIFASSVQLLILGRALQGFGVGALALTGPALMADCFKGTELNRVSGYYSTVYAFIPISAPIIGGYIQDYLGWRANFAFLLLLSIIIYFIFTLKLPETLPARARKEFSFRNSLNSYWEVLNCKAYMLSVACLVLTWSMFVVFSIMAPFLVQVRLGFSPSEYGLFALLVGLGFFVGNSINNFLIKNFSVTNILQLGMIIMIVFSLLLLIFSLVGWVNIWSLMIPIFLIMVGSGLSFPHIYANAVSAVTKHAGVAGALIGSLILIGAVIITALITQLHAHSAVAIASVYLLLSVCCYGIYLWSQR